MTRSHDKPLAPDEAEIWYIGDIYKEGAFWGLTVQCHPPEGCGHEFNLPEDKCPNCNKFLVYRPWCEW